MSGTIQPTVAPKPIPVLPVSDPPPPPPATVSQPTQQTPALISSSPANQSTAGASSGAASAIMVILIWALSKIGLTVPGEVAAAMTALVGAGVHWAVLKYGMTPTVSNE